MITVYGANVTLDELRDIPVERPANAGGTWRGIQHGELVDTLVDECRCRGWVVGDMQFSLAREKADLVGAVDVTIPDLIVPDGITTGIGFMTSNARRKALRMYVGGTVQVCHNGLATGSIVLTKKHSRNTDLPDEIKRGLDRYLVAAKAIPAAVAELKEKPLTDRRAVDIVAQAGDKEFMPKKHLWDVIREYHHPTHPEHGEGTGWALLNAFTMIVKRNPANRQMSQTDGFRQLILAA